MNEIFELPAPQLKALLADVVTPALPGFTHNGAYLWYSSWENRCRKVVRVYPLKGADYIFQWGLCFDFLPVFGESGSCRYERTDKSVGLHLFCWPPGHWGFTIRRSVPCRFSRFGRDFGDVESQLLQAFHEAQGLFTPWFQNCCGLHSALAEARRQCDDPASQYNWPGPDYVKAFLLAVNGDVQTGMKVLDEFWTRRDGDFPPALYEKLQKKLLACANGGDNINDRK